MDIRGMYRDLYIYHGKTKKYHNSTQNCPFSMILNPKWQKFHGDSFPDVKRSKFIYIWWVFTFFCLFWFVDIKKSHLFQRSKIRKTFGVPTASRPTPAEVPYGTIWYLLVPYDTIWYHMVPYGTLCYHKVRYGTIRYLMVPYGTIWYHMVPYGTIWPGLTMVIHG